MLSAQRSNANVSLWVLSLVLIIVVVLFGVPMTYSKATHAALAAGLLITISLAAWNLGAHAIRDASAERRTLAIAGMLFILPFALFSLTAGYGPPQAANPSQNVMRYILLTMDPVLVGTGFVCLHRLVKAHDKRYALPALAAIVIATPLYVIFSLVQLGESLAQDGYSDLSWIASYDRTSLLLLFAGVLLTYAATSLVACALASAQLLSRVAANIFLGLGVAAIGLVTIRLSVALTGGSMWGFDAWYEIPGFALLIPAVPWMMPCALGVISLRRAGAT